jgi:hypothetical protein
MQNVFGMRAIANNNDDSASTIVMQMAALMQQSQLTSSTAANTSQQQDNLIQNLAHQQTLLHANQHQISDQLAALTFNTSDAEQGQCSTGSRRGHTPLH